MKPSPRYPLTLKKNIVPHFPDQCSCCLQPVPPQQTYEVAGYRIPACPVCRGHWQQARRSREWMGFSLVMVIVLLLILGRADEKFPWLVFGFLAALDLSLLGWAWLIRPRPLPGHADTRLEPVTVLADKTSVTFGFLNPIFGLAFGERNGMPRKALAERWKVDPQGGAA